jgi:hypothetical protein
MERDMLSGTVEITSGRLAGSWRWLRRLFPVSLAIALTLLMGSADAWAKGNAQATPPPVAAVPTAQAEPNAEEWQMARDLAAAKGISFDDLYAQREQAAQALGLFEGGDVVIITSTTVIIVLLIILILVIA